MLKAVIFDRDATLNETTQILRTGQKIDDKTDGYVLAKEELRLFPNVKPALTKLRQHGILPFVFTQQNCIGKKHITTDAVDNIHAHMNSLLGDGAKVTAYYTAWQVPGAAPCPRAKPNPTMILEILTDYQLDAEDVVVMGDSLRDYKSAMAAHVRFIWIRDDLNRVAETVMAETNCPIYDDVLQAVNALL